MSSPAPTTATVAFLLSTTPSSDDAFGGTLEDAVRETPVVDRPREDQGTDHASEGRERVLVTAREIVAGNECGQEVHGILQFRGEGCSHLSRLTGDARAERRNDAAASRRIPMLRREVPVTMLRNASLGRLRSAARCQARLHRDSATRIASAASASLGFELAVEGAMGQAGTAADRVDAGRADAVLPEQARSRRQDLLPILRRFLLGDPHRPVSLLPIPLTWW